MIIRKFTNMSADERRRLTKKCCICGKEFLGLGGNPQPYKEEGECCIRCNYDYVIPSRLYLWGLGSNVTEKEEKKEMEKFRNNYQVFPYNFSDELMIELGKYIIKAIERKGYCNTMFLKVEDFIEGMKAPVATISKSEAIECMEKYLSTIGKKLDNWIHETGYKLYWDEITCCVAESERLPGYAFDEPLIKNDEDAIERMAESPNIDILNN